jgi:hypothetical protein
MKLVVVESPFAAKTAGELARNRRYRKAAMLDCLHRGEAPFASHALYTQVLDDRVPEERKLGMEAGFAWGKLAELVVVYTDLGISLGMQAGINRATLINNQTVEHRQLGGEWPIPCVCTGFNHRTDCPEWEPSL